MLSNTSCRVHKENLEYHKDGQNFHWTAQQTVIVMTGVKKEASSKVIKRNLQDSNLFPPEQFPTTSQLPTAGQSSEEQFKFLIHLSSDKRN